jgi:hypothetical protein
MGRFWCVQELAKPVCAGQLRYAGRRGSQTSPIRRRSPAGSAHLQAARPVLHAAAPSTIGTITIQTVNTIIKQKSVLFVLFWNSLRTFSVSKRFETLKYGITVLKPDFLLCTLLKVRPSRREAQNITPGAPSEADGPRGYWVRGLGRNPGPPAVLE